MAQNIYDQAAFFDRYSRLDRSRDRLAGAPEWPMLRSMLPELKGRRVLDLGCGYGWFCRWARDQGAAAVDGYDLSRKMLARARAETPGDGVTYRAGDLETMTLPEGGFDLAFSSLAFHYVRDAARLYAMIHRALAPGGQLVFSTEHPIFMAPSRPGWQVAEDGGKSWPVDRYADEGRRTTEWLGAAVVKYHRMAATTVNLLIDAGFRIRRMAEFYPTAEQIAAAPELAEEAERPMFLLVAAQR